MATFEYGFKSSALTCWVSSNLILLLMQVTLQQKSSSVPKVAALNIFAKFIAKYLCRSFFKLSFRMHAFK